MSESFFEEQKEQSLIKSTIVSKYFETWSKVIINTQKKYPQYDQRIAYIDLFAGPGRYDDGTKSTPVMILENAIKDVDLRQRLITLFNDKDSNNSQELERTIKQIPNINTLTYTPIVKNNEVGESIVKEFESMNFIPTLFFVDPWGYKGLSLKLVNSVLKDWGCDAIFFFNYNRINMGINNESVRKHICSLFGEDRYESLKSNIELLKPHEREQYIIEELCQAIKTHGSKYVLPFCFKNTNGTRTSHHLIFVSKDIKGYEIMKEIMAKESSSNTQGVPSFEYNPSDNLPNKQGLLFELSKPIDDLKDKLLKKYSGKTLTMIDIYHNDNIDTRYIKKNYKEVLRSMYDKGIIDAVNSKGRPPKSGTFGDEIIVTFK